MAQAAARGPRVVVDTNTFISAALAPGSVPKRAYELVQRLGTVITSAAILDELTSVIQRPKFAKYISPSQATDIVDALSECAITIATTSIIAECRDPNDDAFLALALDGEADVILTGDEDLLVLHPWRGVAILSPSEFLAAYRK